MAWVERWESRELVWSIDGSHATRKWIVPWDERYTDMPVKIGYVYPMAESDDTLALYCSDITMRPYARPGEAGSDQAATFAEVTATYKSLDYSAYRQGGNPSPSFGPSMTEQLDLSGDMLNIASGGIKWASDDASTTGQSISYFFPKGDYSITRTLSYFPASLVFSLIGKVNNSVFQGMPKGTVLFLGARASQDTQWAALPYGGGVGSQQSWYKVELHFGINPWGWNNIWREDLQRKDFTNPLLYPFAYLGGLL